MKSLKLKNGDLTIDARNNLELIDGFKEIGQRVKLILETRLGEWFLNENFGFNYEVIQTKSLDKDAIRVELLEALEQEEEFEELLEFDVDLDRKERFLNLTFKAKIDGEEIIEVIEIE